MRKKRLVIAVGGTGGHVFPAQAFVSEIQAEFPGYEVLFAGSGLSSNPYFSKEKYPYVEVAGATPFSKKKLFAVFAIVKGCISAFKLLRVFKPQLVVGFGSYHSFAVLAAAWLLRIPFVLYESNAKPGKVIKLLSKKAAFTALQLSVAANSLKGVCKQVIMPRWIQSPEGITQEKARLFYGLQPGLKTVLVFGGSQGAIAINEAFIKSLEELKKKGPFQVIHLVGEKQDIEKVKAEYSKAGIACCVKPFETQMAFAWEAADMVICRSGAATLAEILHFSVPSVLIPYPSKDNHQAANANFLKRSGAAEVILQQELTSERLVEAFLQVETQATSMRKQLSQMKTDAKESLSSCVHNFMESL